MPNKRTKKTTTVEIVEEEKKTEQDFGEKVATAAHNVLASIVACGHINRQHHNENNELEDLACTLPKGHTGDHCAEISENHIVGWTDAAGTPARKHA